MKKRSEKRDERCDRCKGDREMGTGDAYIETGREKKDGKRCERKARNMSRHVRETERRDTGEKDREGGGYGE